MRVAAYLHNYPPARLLGGELMTSILLEGLVRAGHDVEAIVHEAPGPRERNGVRVVPRRKAFVSDDLAGIDVLISHPEIVAFVRNRIGDAAFVAIVHNLNPHTIDGLRSARADMIVANAEATLPRVRHLARRTMVLHPPTPLGRHPHPPGVDRVFVTAVNLSEDKGGRLFYELARRHPDVPFLGVIGGHGEQIIPDELPANVWIIGQTPSMGLVYAQSRVLLFASATETYGMVAAEACLAGVPVIAHPLPGVREALGDAATWCDRDDVEQWSESLRLLLSDGPEAVAAHGRAIRRGEFLIQRSEADIARFVEAVEEVAATRRRRETA